MFVFLKALCARLFTSAVQAVERTQTVFRLNGVSACLLNPLTTPEAQAYKGFSLH